MDGKHFEIKQPKIASLITLIIKDDSVLLYLLLWMPVTNLFMQMSVVMAG